MAGSSGSSTKQRVFHVSEILFQQILAVFVLLILWELFKDNFSYPVTSLHTWHVILTTLGISLFMAEGVQIFRRESIVTFGHTREDKKLAHLIVMISGFILVTIGISLKINQKENAATSVNHFTSTHAKLGLSSWVLSFVALIGGAAANWLKGGISRISPVVIKIIHIVIGLSAYVVGIACLIYGLEYLVGRNTRGWIALTVLLVIYGTYSLIGPITSIFNYILKK